ncbi:MAG: RNA polymerase sigma factor [Pseudomonadota bacterium]
MDHSVDDRTLLQRVAGSDKSAMQTMYRRHHDAIFAFLRGRGANPDEASDVVHDAMLEVWRTASKYGGQATVKTWMFTIARNKLIDRFRKGARLSYVDEIPDSVDEDPDPEAVAIASDDAERVRSCLGKLKPDHRNVIRLAFFDDLNYDEIAELEGVPKGTVKTRIFHAKKLLMRCLGKR